jgi:hypothetical protein
MKILDTWRAIRFRYKFMVGGSLAILAVLLAVDPDNGVGIGLAVAGTAFGLVKILLAHWSRKALNDYPEADMRSLFAKASEHPIGAGLALVALALMFSAALGAFNTARAAPAQNQLQPHARAIALAPILRVETQRGWPELPWPHYVPALISHESCISYTHSRCWAPTSRLKTQREEGAGLGQLTRAYRQDGSLRFDALAEMRDRHPALRELDWATIYQRPDLQIRALVLMSRGNWNDLRGVDDYWERLAMVDAAYNGGMGGLQNERRACKLRTGCDPQRWYGHVERVCLKSRAALYAGRSACDINRHHVVDVQNTRMPRYRRLMAAV